MTNQNTNKNPEKNLQIAAQNYQDTLNPLIDNLKDQFVDKLIDRIHDIHKDVKDQIEQHPNMPFNDRIKLLLQKHKDDNLMLGLNTSVKDIITQTILLENTLQKPGQTQRKTEAKDDTGNTHNINELSKVPEKAAEKQAEKSKKALKNLNKRKIRKP